MDSKKVEGIFDSISAKYDVANTFISLGLEKYWRRKFNSFISGTEKRIMDACCGTGVSTFDIWKKNVFRSDIYGVDFSAEMLDVARKRFEKKIAADRKPHNFTSRHCTSGSRHRNSYTGSYTFKEADITDTGFNDGFFDLATMLFGIRNITDRKKAISELWRITGPGGRLMIMEFSFPEKGAFRKIYSFYLRRIMVNIGAILTRNRSAYKHLEESIRQFPGPADFSETIKSCGWQDVRYLCMTSGTCIIYTAVK